MVDIRRWLLARSPPSRRWWRSADCTTSAPASEPSTSDVVLDTAGQLRGPATALALPPLPASDDCAEFLACVPGSFVLVGAGIGDGTVRAHHSPLFDIDERCLLHAASVLSGAATRLARDGGTS